MSLPDLLFQGLLGLCVTAGFGILFNVPPEILPHLALLGAGGHIMRQALRSLGVSNEAACFAASFSVGIVGYWLARRTVKPRLIFTVTSIISMVPGIPAFETVIYFFHNDTLNGLQSAVKAILVVGAIAAGLSTARLLTEADLHR